MGAILPLLNILLPSILALYKEARTANPDQPALTDEQVYALLEMDSQRLVATAEAWLKTHPKAGGSTGSAGPAAGA